ncbi:hypothetical protein [Lactiplantibacillus plajomi]|uniref:Uncharacterized protein n=1 Tax=Lactiplantibacillus plajomi TaxID=1457217 RepID=A0ABV6K0E0_9LACO|nr:hypothetical protein [Lactiplantibacillus plajomi]
MATEKSGKYEIYDEKDKQRGRTLLIVAKWAAVVAMLISPFVYQVSRSLGLDLATLAVIAGGARF